MKETLKYIRVLNWGYGGFSPMTLNKDFGKSIQQVNERLEQLESLDEDSLFVEATESNGADNLQKFLNAGTDFEHGLLFMKKKRDLLDSIPTMYIAFKDGADKFKDDGLWTYEQWQEYRASLSQIEKLLENRIKQFAAAYDYNLSDEEHDHLPVDDDQEFNIGKKNYSPTMPMPLDKIHTFLINEGVIPEDTPFDYFIKCVRYADFGGLYNKSRKKVKLHQTFNEIRKKYFPCNNQYRDSLVHSIGKKDKYALTKGAITDDFMKKLRNIM